jgi:hypothetical protein
MLSMQPTAATQSMAIAHSILTMLIAFGLISILSGAIFVLIDLSLQQSVIVVFAVFSIYLAIIAAALIAIADKKVNVCKANDTLVD